MKALFKKNILVTLTTFLLMVSLCQGCGSQASKPLPIAIPVLAEFKDRDPNGVLNLALLGEPSQLNPILSTDASSAAVHDSIYEGLIKIDKNLNFIPQLAESWKADANGKKITFFLKKNVLWHDGKPFMADDVVFTFKKILDPKTNTVRRSNYIIEGHPIKVRKVDAYQVEFILAEPFAPLLSSLSMPIIPEHIFSKGDINTSDYNRKPVGTGPFTFKEWKTGSYIRLDRNEHYHRHPAYIKSIIFRIIPNANTQLVALRKGEIDMADIPPASFARFTHVKGLNLFISEQLQYIYLGYNLANTHFKDKKVRQALAYAVDKPRMVKALFKGLATPAYAPAAPASWAYSEKVPTFPFDPTKAIQILTREGYEKGPNGILQKNGKPFEFTILVNQGNNDRERAAVVIQDYLKKIGVDAKIQVLEWSAMLRKINEMKDPKDFDAVLIGWSLGIDPDGYSLWHSSEYPKGFNFIRYRNPEVDKLMVTGRRELDQAKRKLIYRKAFELIADDQPYLFLWYPRAISAISQRVGGYDPIPGPLGIFTDISEMFVVKKK